MPSRIKVLKEAFWRSSLVRAGNGYLCRRQLRTIAKGLEQHSELTLRSVAPRGEGGSVAHFYHFLYDLLLPLHLLAQNQKSDWGRAQIIKQGPLFEAEARVFPDFVESVEGTDALGNGPTLNLVGFNPNAVALKKRELAVFRESIFENLGLTEAPERDTVLLIVRKEAPDYYQQTAQGKGKGSGAQRRSIINGKELARHLRDEISPRWCFEAVAMEDLSLKEQMVLFNRSHLVIAQHGAALGHCLWLQKGAQVVEFTHNRSLQHFVRICQLRGVVHHSYEVTGVHCQIEVESFLQWLNKEKILPSEAEA